MTIAKFYPAGYTSKSDDANIERKSFFFVDFCVQSKLNMARISLC